MLKHYITSFWVRNLTTYRVLFCIHPRSKILSSSDCTRRVTLLPRTSIHLNRSLTRLKSNLCWNTIWWAFEREIWQRIEYFFVYTPDQKFFPAQTALGEWHCSLEPQFIWIGPWLGWKAIYVEILYGEFLSAKFDNVSSTFLYTPLIKNSFHLRRHSESETPP